MPSPVKPPSVRAQHDGHQARDNSHTQAIDVTLFALEAKKLSR